MKAQLKTEEDRMIWHQLASKALSGYLASGVSRRRSEARAARSADRMFSKIQRRIKK